jgi:hypothetical protein
VAQADYGKFINSTYAWLNWEPSSQEELLVIADTYIKKGLLHDPGFKFSINVDPAQLQGLAASPSHQSIYRAHYCCCCYLLDLISLLGKS